METRRRKLLACLIIVLMVFSGIPTMSFADSEGEVPVSNAGSVKEDQVSDMPDNSVSEQSTDTEEKADAYPDSAVEKITEPDQEKTKGEEKAEETKAEKRTDAQSEGKKEEQPASELSAERSPALAADSPAGNDTYIEYFYTQAFYGGKWTDTDGDGTASENTSKDHYVWTANYSAAGHRFSFRLNYQVGNQSGIDVGEVTFRIPKHILKNRNGVYADTYEMSVPSKEDVESGASVAESAMYAYYEDGDDIVIYNFRAIDSEQEGYVEVSYFTSETSFYYEDMEDAGPMKSKNS